MGRFVGIDAGASTTKTIILDERAEVLGYAVVATGADFRAAAARAYRIARKAASRPASDEEIVISTGYGRRNVPFARISRTEISCHAKGSFHAFPRAHTLIDIGGQDSKVIRVDGSGRRTGFLMNRKCAAGTGAFLEEIANRLKIRLDRLDELARQAKKEVSLGSYCTVFTATEILAKIRQNVDIRDIVRGVFDSVIKRAMEMDPLEGDVVMSGGVVAHNPFLVEMFEKRLGRSVFVPPLPQLTGALGAALLAMEYEKKGG